MASDLYTDRRDGKRPRTRQRLDNVAWRAFAALILSRVNNFAFGYGYPEVCPDGGANFGFDEDTFFDALRGIAQIPALSDEFRGPRYGEPAEPPTDVILDALEWCAGKIGEPVKGQYHAFFKHCHLHWNREEGLQRFVDEVNQIFARNGLAFEMDEEGLIRRLVETPVAVELSRTLFNTGDSTTNELLEQARRRYFDRDGSAGQNALEKLWDAFERVKTLEESDKRNGAERLLANAARNSHERELLDAEMRTLTEIGNRWQIRHHETDKRSLGEGRDLRDYLFERMFSLVRLLLSRTGRLKLKG